MGGQVGLSFRGGLEDGSIKGSVGAGDDAGGRDGDEFFAVVFGGVDG